jgi:hypothetical protein
VKGEDFIQEMAKASEILITESRKDFYSECRGVQITIPPLTEKEATVRANGFQLGAMWAKEFLASKKGGQND